MKILTGNDLADGRVIWWTGSGWSLHVADAVDVGDQAETILAVEEAARRVNASYAIDAEQTADGPRPTVRFDLSLRADDAAANSWIA